MFDKVQSFTTDHVTKFVFENETVCIESVLYNYQDRTVMCISTQCGCPIGCLMCGSGGHFVRNLSFHEMIYQVEYMAKHTTINKRFQIMFMSMGEPFLNYMETEYAIRKLNQIYPDAEILVSTMAPDTLLSFWEKFKHLSKTINRVGLQFSVHAMWDKERDKIIPYKYKLGIGSIINKALEWNEVTGRPVFFNFIVNERNKVNLCEDIYTGLIGAEDRIKLTFSVECPLNGEDYKPFDYKIYDYIQRELCDFDTRMFNPEGQTQGDGCGQLWYVQKWMKDRKLDKLLKVTS